MDLQHFFIALFVAGFFGFLFWLVAERNGRRIETIKERYERAKAQYADLLRDPEFTEHHEAAFTEAAKISPEELAEIKKFFLAKPRPLSADERRALQQTHGIRIDLLTADGQMAVTIDGKRYPGGSLESIANRIDADESCEYEASVYQGGLYLRADSVDNGWWRRII